MVDTLLSGPECLALFRFLRRGARIEGLSEASLGIPASTGPDQGAFPSKPRLRNFWKAID
ncbi:hypothetical protein E4K66_21750 [Bradyrhizobium frederickii]|uniref:Uncharacterized protein n=1 Tax=Bradyrhizobium frederickii TaxID=2560054 RepID=A0A4Y9L1H9_9BRAD|nr:hypothetical protein [Bradyrhizobium frederickii]TFV36646.1 hypothetical protein E4K66_21750 [Bradyrhizobium frederickii]